MKNLNNGYVLSVEKSQAGEPVVIASIRTKDIESQLWQYGEDGRIHNKKTGFVLDIEKGNYNHDINQVSSFSFLKVTRKLALKSCYKMIRVLLMVKPLACHLNAIFIS